MIDLEGTAYPLEPGQTYLLVLQKGSLRQGSLEALCRAAKTVYNINFLCVTVADPAQVQVKGPLQDPVTITGPASLTTHDR